MNIITLGRRGFKSATKLGALALMIGAPVVSHAAIVYSNFGSSFGYNTSQGNTIGNDGFGDDLAQADTFTPSSTLDLSTIEIAISCLASGDCANNFTVDLTSDSAGVPNTASGVLASFTVTGSTLPVLGASTHLTLTYAGPTLALNTGTHYWIVVLPDASGTDQLVWNLNSTSDSSNLATAFAGGGSADTWFTLGGTPGAYEVDGVSPGGVPEPGTLGMMLGGGLLLGLLRKIRG